MTTSDFQAFAQRVLEKHRARAADNPRWALDLLRRQDNPTCAFCCSPIDVSRRQSWGLSPLVPFNQGGPVEPSNLRMACKVCAVERGARDLLAWENLAAKVPAEHLNALKEARLGVLQRSDNHLTSLGRYAKDGTVLDLLRERWKHPRFLVYVERHANGWFVGWPVGQRTLTARNDAAGLLRQVHQARWMEHEEVVGFDVPGEVFQAAVWQLIEHHALVIDLSLDYTTDGERTGQNCWQARYPTLRQVRQRRKVSHETPWPSAFDGQPRVYSEKPNAVRMRTKHRAAREAETKTRWLEARSRLAKRDAEVDAGRIRSYLPGERAALQADVDDLAAIWLKVRQLSHPRPSPVG
ncbi:hypothetical protein ACO0J1_07420 [Stenotrophomonas acidaminiphila]|uniref:hypothetical protein n=1 Tax=Stenotrophomonas acidaminiphila TaxID=128780 RepID=UPI003BF03BD4